MLKRWILILSGLAWLAACVGGSAVLLHYASTAGEAGATAPLWPGESGLSPNPAGETLVVAVHPHCPCTRATMVELNEVMLALRGRVKAYVLAVKPHEFPAGWEDTDVVSSARRIPGATVVVDLDGQKAALFGAQTSGEAMLYDGRGRLMFHGGITEGRGHIGDNPGVERILSLVRTGKADKNESLVFGCPLNAKACPLEHNNPADPQTQPLKGETDGKPHSL